MNVLVVPANLSFASFNFLSLPSFELIGDFDVFAFPSLLSTSFYARKSFSRLKRINSENRVSIDWNHSPPRLQSRSIEEIRSLQKERALKRATTDWNYHIGRGTGLLISVFFRAEAGKNSA